MGIFIRKRHLYHFYLKNGKEGYLYSQLTPVMLEALHPNIIGLAMIF